MRRRGTGALVAALLLLSLPAQGQSPTTPDSDASAAAAPPVAGATPATPQISQVTLDEISDRAEDVATQLRDMTEAISDAGSFSALEDSVFHFSKRVGDRWRETDKILGRALRRAPLETLASSWRALRTELVPLRASVESRLDLREADLASLDRMKESWTWTLQHATSVGVPGQMLERVNDTLAAIAATRAQVDARHSRLLILEDAVSRAMQACDDAASHIADARKQAVSRVFATREQPIWDNLDPLAAVDRGAPGGVQRGPDFDAGFEAVQIYTRAYRARFVVSGLVAVLFWWVLYRRRDLTRRAASAGAELPDFVAYALRSPFATALLLAVVLTRPLRPDPPAALQSAILVLALPAALIVLRPALEPRLMRACYAFVALFVANLARSVLQLSPAVEQWVLSAEMTAAAAAMFWTGAVLRRHGAALTSRMPTIGWIVRRVFAIGGLTLTVAALAAMLGYLELSDFLGGGALSIIYLAIGVLAFRNAAGGVIWLALVHRPLALLRAIDRNRARLEAGLRRALDVTSFSMWMVFTLQTFELFDPVVDFGKAVLDAKLQAGELSISLGRVLGFFVVIGVAWLTARIATFALEEDVYPRMRLARGVPYALSTMVRYGLLLAGFITALATLGLDLTKLTVLVSAFGLGLGFGMQQIINNFVSGLILLFERPVQVGDLVQMKDLGGEVLRIGIRSSTVRTGDGAEVIIPNSDLIQNDVTNWTLSDRRRRVTIDLGVAYGTEAERVLALLVDVAKADPRVLTQPLPDALFTGFGASALQFQLRFWTEDSAWMRLKSDISVGVQSALRDARVGMPVTPVEVQIEGAAAPTEVPR